MNETNSLAVFTRASMMLAEADTIQKTKDLKDKFITVKEWAIRKGAGKEAITTAISWSLEAERKLGGMLAEMEKARGTRTVGGDKRSGGTVVLPPEQSPTLKSLGVTKRESAEAQMIHSLPVKTFESVKLGQKTRAQLKREIREKKRQSKRTANAAKVAGAVKPEELMGKFSCLLIDPPWDWGDEGDVNQLGRAKPDYASKTIDELVRLPVSNLSDEHAHLYLWITNRSLPKGFRLLESWGFRYVTLLTWPKPSFGMGNYFRGQTEHILFGVKGSLALKRKDASTLLPAWKRGPLGHSSKPFEIHEHVESCSPGPYLEMFSRSSRLGWTMWGEGK